MPRGQYPRGACETAEFRPWLESETHQYERVRLYAQQDRCPQRPQSAMGLQRHWQDVHGQDDDGFFDEFDDAFTEFAGKR
jgi:hypothetical protein